MSAFDGVIVPDRLTVPTLGYGAANVGNLFRELSDDDAWAVLDAAWENGIRFYDTAPHYGLGLSERRLGAFLQTKPRDEYVLDQGRPAAAPEPRPRRRPRHRERLPRA